ncbi:Coiled-coil-helix-coiled-coil-helix domain-containing protein 1 [Orchesella cincta]|uniref:Coiled-coil-helix-coiled-coil-helix domain-containing protein 1 n=1 Tax=Orchesella cincta TaxID=48709 RepID=A0A1D2N3Z9_ORCCI|nr:Coiled-coil-helix-coiled-coil-helix domain-containing protein 1 [Orchesella cincta]
MHITEILFKRPRCRLPLGPHEIKVTPFKELLPLRLQNSVSSKSEKGADVSCLQEMAVMFACMKNNDFKEVKCSQEIETFNKCHLEHTASKKLAKQKEESGEIVTGTNSRNLTSKQLNQLLAKYPQFNEKL